MKLPLTLAEIERYIKRHEDAFGFKPTSYGLRQDDWIRVKNEAEQWMTYTDDAPRHTISLSINDVPIIVVWR